MAGAKWTFKSVRYQVPLSENALIEDMEKNSANYNIHTEILNGIQTNNLDGSLTNTGLIRMFWANDYADIDIAASFIAETLKRYCQMNDVPVTKLSAKPVKAHQNFSS